MCPLWVSYQSQKLRFCVSKVVVVCTPLLLEIIVSILKETAKIDKLSTYSNLYILNYSI